MKWASVIPLAVVSLLGCASGGAAPESAVLDTAMMPPMRAVLRPFGGRVNGEASVIAGSRPGQFLATISIMNSQAGQQHPWHVHAGRCDSQDYPVGGLLAYRMLDVRGDGKAESTATVNAPLELNRTYYVDVHYSRANMDLIIACGDLVG